MWFRRKKKPQGRRGLYAFMYEGYGWANKGQTGAAQVEVEELARADGMSNIRILSVSGVRSSQRKQVADLVHEWVPTSAVKWFTDEPNGN